MARYGVHEFRMCPPGTPPHTGFASGVAQLFGSQSMARSHCSLPPCERSTCSCRCNSPEIGWACWRARPAPRECPRRAFALRVLLTAATEGSLANLAFLGLS